MHISAIPGHEFLGNTIEKIRTQMIPFQLKALKDEVEGAEPSHAIENFEIAAGMKNGDFYGMVFQDSDVGKWIEAASYSLMLKKDEALEAEIDNIVEIIGKAQQPDGYLNTYFTVKEPEMRWKNLRECHEMYCAGHLIEGAVAYYQASGKTRFLEIVCRMADHIYEKFGPGKIEGYPGHPELELALYRLAEVCHEDKYAELAELLIRRRGTNPNYFEMESNALGNREFFKGLRELGLEYAQAHQPLREQKRAVGHSVRAMYLYAGATDMAITTGDRDMIAAMDLLWNNVVTKQMYITGGFGATHHGEAFAEDLELPNDTMYAETCASVAFIFWAKRMLKLHRRADIADEMERALYNTVLSGSNLSCDRYFYVNPLEVIPGLSGVSKDYAHVLPERPAWFGCACCPPNMARLLLSLFDYAYDYDGNQLNIHLYVDGEVQYKGVTIAHWGNYPWNGALHWRICCEHPLNVAIRIPGWSTHNPMQLDGKEISPEIQYGYGILTMEAGIHELDLQLEMKIRRIYANPAVRADVGCVALQRGPIVYCVEAVDNSSPLCALHLPQNSEVSCEPITEGILSGMVMLKAPALRKISSNELYTDKPPKTQEQTLIAIPYFAWGNRGLNEMRVWIPE